MSGIPGLSNVLNPAGPLDLSATSSSGPAVSGPILIGSTAPNFGEIVQPFLQPPETGGVGLKVQAPGFGGHRATSLSVSSRSGASIPTEYIIGGVAALGGLLFLVFSRKRRG